MAESPYNLPGEAAGLTEDSVIGIIQKQLSGYTGQVQFNGFMEGQGALVDKKNYQTGHHIQKGGVTALESDGLIYRSRFTGFSTLNTGTSVAIAGAPGLTGRAKFIEISSTVKLYILDATSVHVFHIACSPTSSSFTQTNSTVAGSNPDVAYLSSTLALLAYSSGSVKVRTISGLDSGLTINAEVNVATGTSPYVVRISDTEAVVFYTDSNSDVQAVQITISGTTPTVGTTTTIASHASDVYESRAVARVDTTNTYIFYYRDTTNSNAYLKAATYASGSFTLGSAVSGNVGAVYPADGVLISLSSKAVGFLRITTSGSVGVYGSVVTVSGTTLTVNASTNLGAVGASTYRVTANSTGGNQICLGYRTTANKQTLGLAEFDGATTLSVSTTTLADEALGESFVPAVVKLSPSRMLVARDNTTNLRVEFNVIDMSTNFGGIIGNAMAERPKGYQNYVAKSGDLNGFSRLTRGTEYYADTGGALTTFALGGTKRVGTGADDDTLTIQV